jgi:hypothetical protein
MRLVSSSWQEEVSARLGDLADEGDAVLRTVGPARALQSLNKPPGDMKPVDYGAYSGWRVASLAVLTLTFGSGGVYTSRFEECCHQNAGALPYVQAGVAMLRAAKRDVERGCLRSLEALVSSKVFSDFLDAAKHLLDSGFKDPAASLTGAVLENGLRRIGRSRNVSVKEEDDLNTLDQKLYQAKVYSRLDKKRLQVWIQVRNDADHGHFDHYNSEQVDEMISGVAGFIGRFLVPTAPEKAEGQND